MIIHILSSSFIACCFRFEGLGVFFNQRRLRNACRNSVFVIQIVCATVSTKQLCSENDDISTPPGLEKETSVQATKTSSDIKRDFHEVKGKHH